MSTYIKYFLYNYILFLIMHDRYPVRSMKKHRKCNIVFSVNTGFSEECPGERK
nr:MAG TPA: hypothetical protein [Caudoviricetes sp.]